MKRVILCIGWFTILNFLLNFAGAFIVSFASAYSGNTTPGAEVGRAFSQEYGGIILLAAALIAIVGTVTGILPYTKKEK